MAMKGFATNPMVRYVPLCRITHRGYKQQNLFPPYSMLHRLGAENQYGFESVQVQLS